MSKTLKTVFRAYATIEEAANDCRRLGVPTAALSFSLVDFVLGPLKEYFRRRLSIELVGENGLDGPAEVIISSDRSKITLRIKHKVWKLAAQSDAEAKRILAHEIGHIWLHRDERFKFSEVTQEEHKFIDKEALVEWQAHTFADIFLMPVDFLRGFNKIEDAIDYCDYTFQLPDDVIKRQFLVAQDKIKYEFKPTYGGDICPQCGSERVRSLLSYRKCDDCKNTAY